MTAMIQVLDVQCPTCIFRPGNPMQLRRGRVASMVRECVQRQTFIPCHETMRPVEGEEDEEDPTMKGPICRGFFDAHGHVSQLVRIAERLNAIETVSAPTTTTTTTEENRT